MKLREKGDGDYAAGVFLYSDGTNPVRVEFTKKLSRPEVATYLKAEKNVKYWLQGDRESFALYKHSYAALKSTIDQVRIGTRSMRLPSGRDELLAINSAFLSFLSMKRLYLDHMESRIGGFSELKSLLKSAASEEFDNSFAYRFSEQLRNFAQHIGLPITGLNAGADLDPKTKLPTYHFSLNFIRDELLVKKSVWTAKVRPELEAMPETFEVLPIVEDIMSSMKQIRHKTLKGTLPLIKEDLDIITKMSDSARARSGIPCVFWSKDIKPHATMADLEMIKIPIKLLRLARETEGS